MNRTIGLKAAALGIGLLTGIGQAGWSLAQRLTWNSGVSTTPALAVDSSDGVHVVWSDDSPGNSEIYYRMSTDAGATWTAALRLCHTQAPSLGPAVAVDSSGDPHVVWQDNTPGSGEIYYRRSTDGGASWASVKRLTWTKGWSYRPALAIDSSDHLHLAWEDWTPGNPEIYYKKSTDGGASWTPGVVISGTSKNSWTPHLAVDSTDSLHVVWEDNSPGNFDIYYKKSPDAGASWTIDKRLSWNIGWSQYPAVAPDSSGNPHVVWNDSTPGNNELYYKKSTNGGASWLRSRRITWTAEASVSPAIAPDSSGYLHVVWHDSTPGYFDIYYKQSPDAGTTWGTGQNLTANAGDSLWPVLSVDASGLLHLAWSDDSPGNAEIYYQKIR